jgi:L-histidine Nalpha-methyltransferase
MSALVLDPIAVPRTVTAEFAGDVLRGLARAGQKELPSRWLYDELGSILFEAITLLPEYGLTRADARLLQIHAASIAGTLPDDSAIIELGSGTGTKTRWILEAFANRSPVDYYPIDVSATALSQCTAALESIPGLRIIESNSDYLAGLDYAASRRAPGQRFLVLFLGSTIGNFDYRASRTFLREIRSRLSPGDALLLGADLVKPLPQMLAAYDDAMGVTAAFNLNLLARINRELDSDFDLRRFSHRASFNHEESRIEMHLVSRVAQKLDIRAIDREISFAAGETIWTEGSYKFRREEILEIAAGAGFEAQHQWIDQEWPFAETLMFAGPDARR